MQGVLAFARTQIADRYVPADQRSAALNTLAAPAATCCAAPRTAPDPGLRLSAVRTYIASATAPARSADWLAGDTVPGGPALDPELRWQILGRLAVLGAAGPADIDAELARDSSATGQEGAARCRAALPDPDAKRAAWDALFGDADRPLQLPRHRHRHRLLAARTPRPAHRVRTALLPRRRRHSPPAAAPPSPKPSPAPASRRRSTRPPCGSARRASPTPTCSPPCAANSTTSSTTCARALRVRNDEPRT